ncbi:MAG: bifunctional 23S rRNA (guanine(2069)-N(7))-methyltransferase RlmK/23S rRNA (guanine(2445)-N(2))-methyltransferase RlmL [Halioglobus sp.]|nr:bifunctional 23S rRNA (guanine(2069)-N(7))-methyltransferase RlmK/23S rRNA (guanine(2445)-N(2))-methyltransferase RlmL [Halioglobus sp.]
MSNTDSHSWFATCPKGLETLLALELVSLGADNTRETVAGVYFTGSRALAYRACLWSRLANRILWPLAQIDAIDVDIFYQGMKDIEWGGVFDSSKTIAIDFSGENRNIRNTQFGAQRSKDAIVDWFVAMGAPRPSVDRANPDVRLNVRLVRDRAHLSIDLSGGSLHQRGYRLQSGVAPLKENLAAAVLLRADWPGIAARGGALIDPMCGSATLLLEGAMMSADIAPGLARKGFGFEHLLMHDPSQWSAIVGDAKSRAERGRVAQLPEFRGYDWDPAVIRRAQENIARVGLENVVRVSCKPVSELTKPTHRPLPIGLLVCNPPYGERIGHKEQLVRLYRQLGKAMLTEFPDWQAAVLTADLDLGKATGLRSYKRYALYNGAIAASLLLFDLSANELREMGRRQVDVKTPPPLTEGAKMFANRVVKNRKRLSSWVKREKIDCYRVYDADMPEYSVAVDIYGEHVHVAEYLAPKNVSVESAERRLDEIRSALPEALGVAAGKIFYKQRSRQRGAEQYTKQDSQGEFLTVTEGQAKLLVNLSDYLDTGLFLDHRPLRLRIAQEAAQKDFLNLFCYTGSATIHAALGGAQSTTSIDLSKTYLTWLGKNLAANQLDARCNLVIREDCQSWLTRARDHYDLILLDPPSFSNSKAMSESFDVQRDHPQLVRLAMGVLREDGTLYFSNNRRGFILDPTLHDDFLCEEITLKTLPPDYQRKRKMHCCWLISHK